jgi:hypothetical protein
MSDPSPHSVNSIKTETQRTVSKSYQECILEDTIIRTDERREEEVIILYQQLLESKNGFKIGKAFTPSARNSRYLMSRSQGLYTSSEAPVGRFFELLDQPTR